MTTNSQTCGAQVKLRQILCLGCGNQLATDYLERERRAKNEQNFRQLFDAELKYLSEYYQKEFTEIYESGESYRGKWNWSALFFGSIWVLSKGCWLSALVSIIIILLTLGFAAPIFWIVYGARGNWLYYSKFVHNRQVVL